jgi:hypothetical protein
MLLVWLKPDATRDVRDRDRDQDQDQQNKLYRDQDLERKSFC